MAYTVSFHHGDTANREHNIRNQSYVSSQKHINPNGVFEVWKDVPIAQAYQDLFGSAVSEYNAKQKRSDRKIKSYLDAIRKDSRKKECYEIIFQVGNQDKNLGEKSRDILQKFYIDFQKRNPQLKIIGAYYHADESGKCPHVHLDYIPFATGLKKGLSVQNSLTKALENQGFKTKTVNGKMITAEMQWQKKERDELKKLCEKNAIKIIQPEKKPEQYMASEQMQKLRDEKIKLEEDKKILKSFVVKSTEIYKNQDEKNAKREQEIKEREQEISRREKIFNVPELEKFIAEKGCSEANFKTIEDAISEKKSNALVLFQTLKKNCINLFKGLSGAIKKLKEKIAGYEDRPIDKVIADFQKARLSGFKTYGEFLKSQNVQEDTHKKTSGRK